MLTNIVDTRGYNLVGTIPESNALGQGLAAMMQRKERVNKEAQDTETMRQAGILRQALDIEDDSQLGTYWNTVIEREQDPVVKGELQQLSGYDPATQKSLVKQILTSKGLGQMLPGQDTGAGWQAYKGPDQTKQVDVDDDGQPIMQDFSTVIRVNPRTNQQDAQFIPLSDPYKGDGSPIAKAAGAKAAATAGAAEKARIGAQIEAAPDVTRIEAEKAGAVEQAKADAQVSSAYQIAMEKARANAEQASLKTATEAKFALDQTNPIFKMADEAIANKSGFYSGDYMSSFAGGFLPKLGIVLDQDKLNNTAQLRMALTQLKMGAKPVGSGNPTEGEWKMYAQTIPDPDTATPGQLIYAYNKYKKQVADKYKELEKKGIKTEPSTQAQQQQPQVIDWSSYE